MNKSLKIFIGVLLLGTFILVGAKFVIPIIKDRFQTSTSDAANIKGTLKISIDNWVGYYPLCSKHMKSKMRDSGFVWECIDDKADMDERMSSLKDKKTQFAVASIDSYITGGKEKDYPGTIITVIDESKGGDAIVSRKAIYDSLDGLKTNSLFKIAFTPNSPSEHLLRSVGDHFDIAELKDKNGKWRVETDGAADAYKKLMKGEVSIAVLWQPYVSKAVSNPDFIKILGTEDTSNLIVDVLLVERDFSKDNQETVSIVLSNYFKTLKYYRTNEEELKKELKDNTDSNDKEVEAMLQGVLWYTLYDNATKWFGVSSSTRHNHLADTIDSTVDILINTKFFKSNPFPQSNMFYIVNSFFIDDLYNRGSLNSFGGQETSQSNPDEFEFLPLAADRWGDLREVGTLKIRPITFQSGTFSFDSLGEIEMEKAVKNLKHYPHFRVVARGHTDVSGDPEENKKLSLSRASAVRDYLVKSLNVDPNRIHFVGFGGEKPLKRGMDQSFRGWKSSLSRVELVLVDEVY